MNLEIIALVSFIGLISICGYSASFGLVDSVLWSRKGAQSYPYNEHIFFVANRIFVFNIMICFAILDFSTVYIILGTSVGGAFMFPFFHNGFYYLGRKKIGNYNGYYNVYRKGFWSEPSDSSSATINFSLVERVMLGIIGLLLYVTGVIVDIVI